MLAKMRANPRDWSMETLLSLAVFYGVEVRHDGGSHYVFTDSVSGDSLTVPFKRPIKPVYVRRFVEIIDAIRKRK